MALEHSSTTTLQSTPTPAVFCQGRALSSAEVLGLQGARLPFRCAFPLLITAWIGLLLVVSNPLVSLATIFAAPLLLPATKRR